MFFLFLNVLKPGCGKFFDHIKLFSFFIRRTQVEDFCLHPSVLGLEGIQLIRVHIKENLNMS